MGKTNAREKTKGEDEEQRLGRREIQEQGRRGNGMEERKRARTR